jgi:hypothetical protein
MRTAWISTLLITGTNRTWKPPLRPWFTQRPQHDSLPATHKRTPRTTRILLDTPWNTFTVPLLLNHPMDTALRPLDTPSSSAFHTQTDTQANTQANTQADTPSLTQSSFNQLQWATCLTAWAARLVVPALALLATGALAPLS